MRELKPCPFCGSEAETCVTYTRCGGDELTLAAYIQCKNCGIYKCTKFNALNKTFDEFNKAFDEVTLLWNQRV